MVVISASSVSLRVGRNGAPAPPVVDSDLVTIRVVVRVTGSGLFVTVVTIVTTTVDGEPSTIVVAVVVRVVPEDPESEGEGRTPGAVC